MNELPFLGRSIPPYIQDFTFMKHWKEVHSPVAGLCGKSHSSTNLSFPVPLSLIYCHTRKVILACKKDELLPGSYQFVALSYVWGQGAQSKQRERQSSTQLPDICPRVIEDALVVTKKLGFSYLWVDRFCIERDNMDVRTEQIACMDFVYGSAAITIIAAADDPETGLYGISSPRVDPPSGMQFGYISMFYTTTSQGALEDSVWNTRGWTYQERVLAKHRLVFTKHQSLP